MTAVFEQAITGPGAWKASDFPGGADDIAFDLGPRHRAAIAQAMEAVSARGLATEQVGRADFALPEIAGDLAELAEEIDRNSGIVVIRGFPVDDYSQADIETVYWGIGTHFGTPVSQSVMGDHLGHVIDVTDVDPHARAYRARQELSLHTDLSDIACLLCIHPAGAGGLSRLASALAIHNEMLATRPDLLAPLYRGFHWHRFGEQGADEDPITPYRVPHFSYRGGRLSCRYVRTYIREGAFALGEPLDEVAEEALDTFDEIGGRPDFQLEFTLRRGEAVFMNNLTVLHARSAFENQGDPARKRHLMRLWLASHTEPAVVPEIQVYSTGRGGGVPKQEDGRMPSFERHFETG